MRWYINDLSLAGQYDSHLTFESVLRELLRARSRVGALRANLYAMRSLTGRPVVRDDSFRQVLARCADRDLRTSILIWLDRAGPFIDDDRYEEPDDYFEHLGEYISDSGLGEAARRIKSGDDAATFSFSGGRACFDRSPLLIDHGLPENRLGAYSIRNFWLVDDLEASSLAQASEILTWQTMVQAARERFPRLIIPDSVYLNEKLSKEPFAAVVRDRTLTLLAHLDRYMEGRNPDGSEGPAARSIIRDFFTGDRALFSGESPSNQRDFREELTFRDPMIPSRSIFAHWHGKISYRFYRIHFEWPVPTNTDRLKVVYIGPKITKA